MNSAPSVHDYLSANLHSLRMKWAAIFFGCLAAFVSCIATYFFHYLIGPGVPVVDSVLALGSIASVLGTAISILLPRYGGAVLLCTAAAWFVRGVWIGDGFPLVLPFVMLNGLAGVLALSAGAPQPPDKSNAAVTGEVLKSTRAYNPMCKWPWFTTILALILSLNPFGRAAISAAFSTWQLGQGIAQAAVLFFALILLPLFIWETNARR